MTLADLSPTAILQLGAIQTPTPIGRARWRSQTRRQVLDCTNCQLHAHQPAGCSPVPFAGPRSPSFVVLGDAPDAKESSYGTPFVGPAGRLLRSVMEKVGIDHEEEVLWTNTVSCFPNVEGVGRLPSDSETAFCRENMLDQIEAGYTKYVLLVGGRALNAFRSDLQVTRDHGRVFVWMDLFCVMPIIHPAGALRKRDLKGVIERDLERWAEVVYGGDDPTKFLGEECVKCGKGFTRWDRDGVPWCKDHWKDNQKTWEKERIRWNEKIEPLTIF